MVCSLGINQGPRGEDVLEDVSISPGEQRSLSGDGRNSSSPWGPQRVGSAAAPGRGERRSIPQPHSPAPTPPGSRGIHVPLWGLSPSPRPSGPSLPLPLYPLLLVPSPEPAPLSPAPRPTVSYPSRSAPPAWLRSPPLVTPRPHPEVDSAGVLTPGPVAPPLGFVPGPFSSRPALLTWQRRHQSC